MAKTNSLFLLVGLCLVAFFAYLGLASKPAAAANNNQTINFQGRLLNSQGAAVVDGFYNIQFKIYQDGDGLSAGDTTGSPAGSLKWTENYLNSASHGVKVVNGFMSVPLGSVNAFGSNIDWNQGNLWLSMNVGDTSSCTITTNFTADCNGDGEMLPMQPLTASPYAMNSGALNGLTSNNFVQLAQGLQTDNTNVTAISINKTGTGKILDLQASGTDVLTVDTSGNTVNIGITGSTSANSTVHIADSSAGVQIVSIGSANSTSATTINAGSGGLAINATTTLNGTLDIASTAASNLFRVDDNGSGDSSPFLIDQNGNVVIGLTSPQSGSKFTSYLSTNATSGAVYNSYSLLQPVITSASTANYYSNFSRAEYHSSSTAGINSGGSLNAQGIEVLNSSTTVLDTAKGITVTVPTNAGTITNTYGVYVGDITAGTQTNTPYSFYASDGNARNYFAGTAVFQTSLTDSGTAFQVQNSSGKAVLTTDTSGGQIVLGNSGASGVTGKIKMNFSGQTGSITLAPLTPGSTNYTINLPAENGTVCTTAATGVCNTAGGLSNVAYLNQTQSFTGTNTFQPSTNISSLIVKQTTVSSPSADIFDVQTVNNSKAIAVTSTATDNASLRLASVGSGSTVLVQGDDEKISFSGTESRILIDTTGSSISNFIDFFRNSNTTSSRRLRVFKGDNTSTETFGIDASNGNVLMGSNLDLETAGTLTIGGSTATTVTLGSTTASSGSQTFNVGTNATAGTYTSTVNIGSGLNASTTTIKGGTGGINLNPDGGSNTGVLVKPTNGSTAGFQVQNSSSNSVLSVDTTGNQILLGKVSTLSGKLSFASAGGGTISIAPGSTANTYTLTLPASGPGLGQCLQNDGSTVGQLTFGACGASGTFLNKNSTDTSSAAGGSGYLYGFTSTGTSTGGVLSLNNSTNTGSTLSATTAGNPASGKAVIYGENTNASPSGNLLDLESGSTPTSKFSVNSAGNVTAAGTYNTNTFTGSSLIFGAASAASLQAAASQALNITGNASSTWSVGGTNQNLTIQTSGTGTLALDTVGAGTVNIGTGNATTIGIGNNSTTTITIGGSTSTGSVTTRAQGITHTLTGSATTPTDIIKTSTDNSGAFQVQNHSSQAVFSVDTSANKAVLGLASNVDGNLLFQNHTNGNGITINSTGANASYTLTLPSQAPSGGLCIQTSTGTASQLVFASCANNNTSISKVAYWDANSTNVITSVTPSTVGDVIVLTTQIPNTGVTVSSIASSNVTTWNKVVANNGNGTVSRVEMWVGTVTSLTTSNITVTYVGGTASGEEVTATEFTAAGVNQSTSWGIESSSSQLNSTASTTVTYPSLTAVNGAELYIGYAQAQNPPVTCPSCTSFTPIQTSTQHNMIEYNPSLTANTNYQPTATQGSSGQSNTVAAILTAFVTSTAINNSTSLQKANFYVQAANAGSVAGVLQAASSGSADIMDLRNSGGTNVVTVGSTGDVAIKSPGSTTALQVQNSSGYSVMAVDTSGNSVVLGDATHLSGSITFKDSGDSNTISITAPTSIATSYSLALPTNTPTAGLCLATSPSNANQLIFSSCATQVSAASISYVNKWDSHATGSSCPCAYTISDSPANLGDLLVVYTHSANNVTVNSNGVSGGGVTNWYKVTSYTGGGTPGNIEMWRGVVTSVGSNTVTVTYGAAPGVYEIVAEEFTMGSANGTWAIDTSGTATTTSSVTTVNYPTLTPLNSNELYTGYAYGGGTMSSSSPLCGTTSGFTYVLTGNTKCLTYKTNVTGGTAYTPQATQTSGVYASIAAVVEAFTGTSVIVNTTSVQQANFDVQAATSGTVAGILQAATSGTADVFQVQDSTGNNVMSVNPTSGVGTFGLTLGTPNVSSGQIIFNSSGNSNYITLTAPSAPGSSYQLILPSSTPAPGQCLSTSPSNANQLVFSSCANQVTSVAISFVNSWKTSTGSAPATLSVSPANVGDLMVLFVSFQKADSVDGAGVSGGGCSTWSKVASTGSGSGTDTTSIEMYRCQTTSTGSSNISVAWSGPAGTHELAAMEFTTGSTTGSWVVDSSNTQYNSSATTTTTWPSLTPQSSKDLYVGYGASGGSTYTGSVTGGFTAVSGSLTNREGLYNTSVSATTQPTATTSGSAASLTVGALVAAYSSSSVISNSTVTQVANFNIQAATSGSVAGVLQAFPTGSGHILDLLDGSGTLVDSFDSIGNLLVKPSTAGAAAFQVQNTSSVNVLSVDTSAKQVIVGAGSTGESSASLSLLVIDNQTGSSADPGTAVNGAMYYNATTHEFRCGVASTWQNCSGLLSSNTSKSSDVNNCTNNCAAFDRFASIPGGYCQAGRVIKLEATGYFSSTGSPQLQFGVYYGLNSTTAGSDVLLGSLSPATTVTSASNNYFDISFNVICYSPTAMQTGGVLNMNVSGSSLTTMPLSTYAASGTTVTSSSSQNLYIFPIWDTANASNTARLTQLTVTSP